MFSHTVGHFILWTLHPPLHVSPMSLRGLIKNCGLPTVELNCDVSFTVGQTEGMEMVPLLCKVMFFREDSCP